jgi:hypothetical protein
MRHHSDPNWEPSQRRYERRVRWHGLDMAAIYDTSVRGAKVRSESDRRWVIECNEHHQRTSAKTYHDACASALDRSWWCDGDGDMHPEDAYSWEVREAEGR